MSTRLVAASDAQAADWIVESLQEFGRSVVGLVPAGFPAYVRVFHPAYRLDPSAARPRETKRPVSWAEIAEANGTRAHAEMQLSGLTGSYRFVHAPQPGVYEGRPVEGSLPVELRGPLAETLARHTETPDRCWFAVWNGFGAYTRNDVRAAPVFRIPAREYFLLRGPIEAIEEGMLDPPHRQSANIWWPEDQSWCVATEIDADTTYIACNESCRDDLLRTAELEAFQIDPGAGIDWNSDRVNPRPPPSST